MGSCESVRKAVELAYRKKLIQVRDQYSERLKDIHNPPVPFCAEVRVSQFARIEKQFAKDCINAYIDAFEETHQKLHEYPVVEDVECSRRLFETVCENSIEKIASAYNNPTGPYTTPALQFQQLDSISAELRTYPGLLLSRLQSFVHDCTILKERGLPIGDHIQNITNNSVFIGRDANGPMQLGSEHSAQTLVSLPQEDHTWFSEDEQAEAISKIRDWLEERGIALAGEWISYKEIAIDIYLDTNLIKECIDFAAIQLQLKIENRHPGSVYIERC